MFTERQKMAKKSSASSRREKLVSVRAEDIFNKPLSQAQRRALERLKAMPESEIDYSDIPPLTDEQLASGFRPKTKQSIACNWIAMYSDGSGGMERDTRHESTKYSVLR
jgi:hypothetical protein